MRDRPPAYWPVAELISAYRAGQVGPVEVVEDVLARIDHVDPQLNGFITATPELALDQARAAEVAFRRGESAPLLGVPVSIKDTFHVEGVRTTFGSLIHRQDIANRDSGVARRLRAAGAVFVGKTNMPEFGQSATTDNRLLPDTRNPWDPSRTPGGSSGGAATSVAAGMATLAVGSDGGGSIRIPAAFTGLFGIKPTAGICRDEDGFRGMTEFVSPGPLAWRVADARTMLEVLSERRFPRDHTRVRLRVAWCLRPEGRPVHPGIAEALVRAGRALEDLGHEVVAADLPIAGWSDAFGPLVLEEERVERGHLLERRADELTWYERRFLEAAAAQESAAVERARSALVAYRAQIATIFDRFDLICTPTVAVPAFPIGHRPRKIDNTPVDGLWGAFPFAVPFNVAHTVAASVPCGFVDGLPAGLQIVAPADREGLVLDTSEALEEALSIDTSGVVERWVATAVNVNARA